MSSTAALTVVDARGDAAMRCWSEMVATEQNRTQCNGNECNATEVDGTSWDVLGNVLCAVLRA
jgi:hypothetical protein